MKKPLDLQKKQLRKILKEQRNRLDHESCASSDNAIFMNIRTWDIYQKAYTVFCFVGYRRWDQYQTDHRRYFEKRKTGRCTKMYQQRNHGSIWDPFHGWPCSWKIWHTGTSRYMWKNLTKRDRSGSYPLLVLRSWWTPSWIWRWVLWPVFKPGKRNSGRPMPKGPYVWWDPYRRPW